MAVVIVAFGRAVGYIAMPALAGLLMLIGYRTIKPADLRSQWKIGTVQRVVLVVTFVLTMLIPLQYAVLVGVGLSVILYVVRQSNQVTIKSWRLDDRGQVIEGDPPQVLPANEVVVLQPYGSLFFASAPVFESQLPAPIDASRNSVVILRLRGRSDLGTTFLAVLHRYAEALAAVGSKLVLVSVDDPIREQLAGRPDHRGGAAGRHLRHGRTGWRDATPGPPRCAGLGRRPSRRRAPVGRRTRTVRPRCPSPRAGPMPVGRSGRPTSGCRPPGGLRRRPPSA